MPKDFVHSYLRRIWKEYDAYHPHEEQQPAVVRYRALLFTRFALGHATEAEILLLPRLYFRGNDEIRALMEKYIRRNTSRDENARISGWFSFPDDPEAAEMVYRSINGVISRKDSAKLQQRWNDAHKVNGVDGCCIQEYITDEEKEALAAEYDIDIALISNDPLPGKHVWCVGGRCSNPYEFAPDGSYQPRGQHYDGAIRGRSFDRTLNNAFWGGPWEAPDAELAQTTVRLHERRDVARHREPVKFVAGFAAGVLVGIVAYLVFKRQKR